jgi:hypothetical protein
MPEELQRRRHERRGSAIPPFLKAYWVEILIVIGLLLGIFLMFERIQIRVSLLRWLNTALRTATSAIGRLDDAILYFVTHIGLSELISIPLLAVVFLAIIWRIRWRVRRTPSLTDLHCPRCKGNIHRVHRHTLDHLTSIIVPVRRYHCTNRECGWSGVRVATRTHSGRPRTSPG